MKSHNYFVYIITNPGKTVLYVGVTNDLVIRLEQHKANRAGRRPSPAATTAINSYIISAILMYSTQ
ncbi:GIY-YIG nuclease family protein [Pontibacter chitinilyticus]|uniref:GIY-YIG nuclease family protein n=1 Tax=Pontibacter chitinilyticus TaxID=2674989 RepID=UPI003D29EF77